jgi:hypothetical protein
MESSIREETVQNNASMMVTDRSAPERRQRRWLQLGYAVWLVGTIAVLAADVSDPSLLYLALILILPVSFLGGAWLTFPTWALVKAIAHARRRDWRRALTFASAPILAVLIVLEGRFAADVIRFQLERGRYLAAIETKRAGAAVPRAAIDLGPPVFAYFNWGGMIWASKGVAYDESDEAGKPDNARSEAWRNHRKNSEISCDAGVRPLGGHFYMVYAGC